MMIGIQCCSGKHVAKMLMLIYYYYFFAVNLHFIGC